MGLAATIVLLAIHLLVQAKWLSSQAQSGTERLKLPRVVIACGGPYSSRDQSQVQTYRGSIEVPSYYASQPLSLVCTNGGAEAMGFQWVRMFLVPGDENSNEIAGAQPYGRLLIDEHSFMYLPQVYIEMTGQLHQGRNPIIIEGVGVNGAAFEWELRSINTPLLYPGNSQVYAGQSLWISGSGFSSRPEENVVQLGPGYLHVESSNFSQIQVRVPNGWPPGEYDLTVSLQQYRSKSIKVQVFKPPSQR